MKKNDKPFRPVSISVLTVSDSRSLATDSSGSYLCEAVQEAGHHLCHRDLVPDDRYLLRAVVSQWIADPEVDPILSTGGTGLTGRDGTPQAVLPLFDKTIEGFGELFRHISFTEIGPSTIQSRALAGVAGATLIFCLPGSTGACRTAWNSILLSHLDSRTSPCNFTALLPRLTES